ncbi:copia protein, partial [Tanacetum coccineum]
MGYFQLIRANGSSKRYSSMIQMLQNIGREDLETLWKLVKAKHGNTRPEEAYERTMLVAIKNMTPTTEAPDEGHIGLTTLVVGFDEYMNLVLDQAEEVIIKKKTRKPLGLFCVCVWCLSRELEEEKRRPSYRGGSKNVEDLDSLQPLLKVD